MWRAAKAKKLMSLGDPEPSHLPCLSTLRKAKSERGSKELQHKDPVLSLQLLTYSANLSGIIFLFCYYWTPSQMEVYKSLSKLHGSSVSFDTTGSVAR